MKSTRKHALDPYRRRARAEPVVVRGTQHTAGERTEPDTAAFLRALSRLTVSIDRSPGEDRILTLARRHRLTVYDAAYLELAQREGVQLATLDETLERAARLEGVPPLSEVRGR